MERVLESIAMKVYHETGVCWRGGKENRPENRPDGGGFFPLLIFLLRRISVLSRRAERTTPYRADFILSASETKYANRVNTVLLFKVSLPLAGREI